ncbi:ArsR/SmtB family transcription factor [Nocardiopsis trehalosi]|uniref:ArsR/SmtB family transcription factor n=1 Tax=Nocardiopsis trehalosi TaxID=109329 RepID=UPI000835B595|nr:metalloregulator ArsR/SmtB family transcription factor [Nocardiopsis trehalosi]
MTRHTPPPPGPSADEAVFAALADPTRRAVLDALAAHGPATATGLARRLPVTRQAVAKHLAVLERAGLVAGRRHGREVRYLPRPDPLDAAARHLTRLADAWRSLPGTVAP